MKFAHVIMLVLIFLGTMSTPYAADFDVGDGMAVITGQINPGDYERFRDILLTGDKIWTTTAFLDSPGGDVVESLKFANLFDKMSFVTMVSPNKQCFSSCFLMWAAGVHRMMPVIGELGVHRITLKDYQDNMRKAKGLVSPLSANVGNYLSELGIPRSIIDKMNETPASQIFKFDEEFIVKNNMFMSMTYQPTYLDMIEKACGSFPDPWPGVYPRDRPRDEATKAKIMDWIGCEKKIRLKNTRRFLVEEYFAMTSGKPTVLLRMDHQSEIAQTLGLK